MVRNDAVRLRGGIEGVGCSQVKELGRKSQCWAPVMCESPSRRYANL